MQRRITEKEWLNAIEYIAQECHKAPDDSVVDICNEVLVDLGFKADWFDAEGNIKISTYTTEAENEEK